MRPSMPALDLRRLVAPPVHARREDHANVQMPLAAAAASPQTLTMRSPNVFSPPTPLQPLAPPNPPRRRLDEGAPSPPFSPPPLAPIAWDWSARLTVSSCSASGIEGTSTCDKAFDGSREMTCDYIDNPGGCDWHTPMTSQTSGPCTNGEWLQANFDTDTTLAGHQGRTLPTQDRYRWLAPESPRAPISG